MPIPGRDIAALQTESKKKQPQNPTPRPDTKGCRPSATGLESVHLQNPGSTAGLPGSEFQYTSPHCADGQTHLDFSHLGMKMPT